MQWSIAVVVSSARHLLKTMDENFSENITEENHKRVLKIIKGLSHKSKKREGWIRRRDIYQKCRFMTSQTLENLLLRYETERLVQLKPGDRGGKGLLVRIKQKGEKNAA